MSALNSELEVLHGNYTWLATHGEAVSNYCGEWVAVANKKIIAHADSLKELLVNPSVKKEKQPFVTKIPLPEEAVASLSLS